MELGPIQKEWIKSLKEHPERQLTSQLGRREGDSYKACCLGEYGIICGNHGIGGVIWNGDGELSDVCECNYLYTSFEDLGLSSAQGAFIKNSLPYKKDPLIHMKSLAQMNDNGYSWSEIAEYVESDPSNIFTKSL